MFSPDVDHFFSLSLWAYFFAACVLHFWGFHFFSRGLHAILGLWGKGFLESFVGGPWQVLSGGFVLGLFSQNFSRGGSFLYGLTNAGLIPFTRAARLLLGMMLSPFVLWLLLWKLPFSWGMGFLILSAFVGLLVPLFATRRQEEASQHHISWERVAECFLGLSFLILAQGVLRSLANIPWFAETNLFVSFFPREFFSGGLFALVGEYIRLWIVFLFIFLLFRKALVPVGLAAAGLAVGLWNPVASLALISAFFFSEAFLSQRLGKRANIYGQKLVRLTLICAFLGLAFDVLLLAFILFAPELFNGRPEVLFTLIFVCRTLFVWLFLGAPFSAWNHFVRQWLPQRPLHGNFRLRLLEKPEETVPALSLLIVRRQVERLKTLVDHLMGRVKSYVEEGPRARILGEIKKIEAQTDEKHEDVAAYLRGVQLNPLTGRESLEAHILLNVSYELEKIADYLDKVATYSTRLGGTGAFPTEELETDFWSFWRTIEDYYQKVTQGLRGELRAVDPEVKQTAKQIKSLAEDLREDHLRISRERGLNPEQVQNYSDMVIALRKVRGHTYNIFKQLSYLETS